jgi:Protein of unknown function (DUF2723)
VTAAVFTVAVLFYLPALPVQVRTGDTAEYQTVPWILGIAHPTGFPFYTLAGWVWVHALTLNSVAWRMNALSALCTALTAASVAWLAMLLDAGLVASAAAALTFALGSVVWHGAAFATPHSLSGLFIIVAMTACVAFARNGNVRALLLACGAAGLGLATQPETIWVLPALLVAALWQRSRISLRTVAAGLALLLVPLLFYAYLPIRSTIVAAHHLDPNDVAPLYGVDGIDWDLNQTRTREGFLNEVLGRGANAGPAVARSLNLARVPIAIPLWLEHARAQYAGAFSILVALGTVALALRDRRALSVIVAGSAGGLLFTFAYRSDVELYRYFLVISAAGAAVAAAAVRLPLPRVAPELVARLAAFALVCCAVDAWYENRGTIAETSYGGAQNVIDAVRRDTPDNAIVVAAWYDATTLGYGQNVEGVLGDRLIVKAAPGEYADAYQRWARVRPVIVYANRSTSQSAAGVVAPNPVRELPSSLPYYRIFEIRPNAAPEP